MYIKPKLIVVVYILILLNDQNSHLPVHTLAELLGVSKGYIESLLQLCRYKRLVIALRGRGGGYQLAKPLKEITLNDIDKALTQIRKEKQFPLPPPLKKIKRTLDENMGKITLAQIAAWDK